MKYTLLEISQILSSSLDSEDFDSIFDTVESRQIAEVVRQAYFNIVARSGLPEHYDLFELNASGDNAKPTLMFRPEDVRHIDWLKYNKRELADTQDNFTTIEYMTPGEFFNYIDRLSSDDADVDTFTHAIGSDTFDFLCQNNKHPEYYTLFDDYTVVFDSYQSEVDTTLDKAKTKGYGEKEPGDFLLEDSFIPDLDEKQFALLLSESKALAFLELKQIGHDIALRDSNRQWVSLQKNKGAVKPNYFNELPNFGRRTTHHRSRPVMH